MTYDLNSRLEREIISAAKKFGTRSIGVGNVCEARFALPKTTFKGVTIALVWER